MTTLGARRPALITTISLIVIAVVVARKLLSVVTIDGHSMAPVLNPGDRLLVTPVWRPVRRGDLVAIRSQQLPDSAGLPPLLVKRVVAIGGDVVPDQVGLARPELAGTRVPADQVIVLGEHPRSLDSKQWGPLPVSALAGLAAWRLSRPPGG